MESIVAVEVGARGAQGWRARHTQSPFLYVDNSVEKTNNLYISVSITIYNINMYISLAISREAGRVLG